MKNGSDHFILAKLEGENIAPSPEADRATRLHQLGFDHVRLTYRFQGRDFRLTDVHGQVAKALLA